MPASSFAIKRLRTPEELAAAADQLRHAGYMKASDGTWVKMPDCCLHAIQNEEETGEASCVFGCGSRIDDDTKMCDHCRDHSANSMECEAGHTLEKWGDEWERIR